VYWHVASPALKELLARFNHVPAASAATRRAGGIRRVYWLFGQRYMPVSMGSGGTPVHSPWPVLRGRSTAAANRARPLKVCLPRARTLSETRHRGGRAATLGRIARAPMSFLRCRPQTIPVGRRRYCSRTHNAVRVQGFGPAEAPQLQLTGHSARA
jgi:hypothetical protein